VTVGFTPSDHVTEREPGRWEDCTFASVLETLRIALPEGREIPATVMEVNRFRAEAGLVDNHPGVTIERVMPTAKRLYGVRDDQYTLTRNWPVAEAAMKQPRCVFVLTGLYGLLPSAYWITSFRGAHAVAGRGHPTAPTLCDPLGPKDGEYEGSPCLIRDWKRFASGLEWQMLIMEAQGGGDGMIAAGGIKITSDKLARAMTATPVLDAPNGKKVTTLTSGQKVPYMGNSSAHRAVLLTTGIPYPDKIARPTILYVANNAVSIEDAPPAPAGDVRHEVATTVDGIVKWKETI
jgi:hypothetical protein